MTRGRKGERRQKGARKEIRKDLEQLLQKVELLPRGPLSWIVSSQRSSLKRPPTFPPQSTLSCD